MRRPLRWALRTVLVLVSLATIAISTAIIFIHTNYGREQLRAKVDDQLAQVFVGGGHVGKIEGSVFGELVLRDVVINGPDHLPAIQIKTLRPKSHVLDLIPHHARSAPSIAQDPHAQPPHPPSCCPRRRTLRSARSAWGWP